MRCDAMLMPLRERVACGGERHSKLRRPIDDDAFFDDDGDADAVSHRAWLTLRRAGG